MFLKFLSTRRYIISEIEIKRFRKERSSYELVASLILCDNSVMHIKDYMFENGVRKYAYHWVSSEGQFLGRWDNAPHWPGITTHPHHFHNGATGEVEASTIKDIESLFDYAQLKIIVPEAGDSDK